MIGTEEQAPGLAAPAETRLNELLRQVDWRFLLRQVATPSALDLSSGRLSEALRLVSEPAGAADGATSLVLLDHPTRASARSARAELRPGGEVACLWWTPRPLGIQMARRRLRGAGFVDVRFYWPGPQPGAPKFWLPLHAPRAIEHVLSQRPPQSVRQAALRRLWRVAVWAGALAPVCAVARAPEEPVGTAETADPLAALLPAPEPWVLLTGGDESASKIAGLPFFADTPRPEVVVKFGRVEQADVGLEREAATLHRLERERPELPGVPRIEASGHRAGRSAIAQTAIHGRELGSGLSPEGFADVAPGLTRWLIALAGKPQPQPSSNWAPRLVAEPLDELERDFGPLLPPGLPQRARRALAGLGELPLVWEHRDLGPWNVVIGADGAPAVIDWEDAEPLGLPGLDLTFLLATTAFVADGSMGGADGVARVRQSYARLLDPDTSEGAVATACFAEYGAALGIGAEELRRLRLLCWIVQGLIAFRLLARQAEPGSAALGDNFFIGLAEDEAREIESAS